MAKFSCLPAFSIVRRKKSKAFFKEGDGTKKGRSKGDIRVKPIDPFSPSPENISSLILSKPFPSVEKGTCITSMALTDDSFEKSEPTEAAAYEGDDELGEIRSMKRDYSDLNLQPKGELASHGSSTDLKSCVLEKTETDKGIVFETMFAPVMELTASSEPPVLKRSCSDFETMQTKQRINSPKGLSSYSNLHCMSGNESPVSVMASCSADRVVLKRRSSSQILPSRSKKIQWKIFLRSQKNLQNPGQKLDEQQKKLTDPETEWATFSSGSSHLDRVNAWVNSLQDCSFIPVNVEDDGDEIEDEETTCLNPMEISESSEKTWPNRPAAAEVTQAKNIIQSLNTFSMVADFPGVGLKSIPSISAFACLRCVNLSGNCIVTITPGSLPKTLHTLDLSRNKISTIDGLRDLERLRVLNLSYNRIAKISHGLSSNTLIKELYLAGNKISNVEGLHRLLKLTVLDLSFNKIITAKGLGQLVANYNSLLALNLLGNPILSNIGDDQLRKAVLNLLPHVTYLNKQHIKPDKVREVVSDRVTKAALGDAAGSSKRKLTKRLSKGSGSLPKSKAVETIKPGKARRSMSISGK
ncbi:uncharacterized protein LOC110033557 [Phalaenopsis equestris]|uniref:uncharacterized protein LOC110033557 n=1 Tax=Phalaenopsis equestris TaxID=78828 RepID=UPI0009E34604|nr:uncharacterized protein LOC110033557 [Phalaenopsis equestris]